MTNCDRLGSLCPQHTPLPGRKGYTVLQTTDKRAVLSCRRALHHPQRKRRNCRLYGTGDELIEMLFVRPDQQGKGYGKRLMEYAVHQKHIHKVDVNEQNGQACRFYQHMDSKWPAGTKPTRRESLSLFCTCNYQPHHRLLRLNTDYNLANL